MVVLVLELGGGIAKLVIGKFCIFGLEVSIHLVSDHHTDWVTAYDINVLIGDYVAQYKEEDLVYKGDIVIGNDVWVGERAEILPGITLGDGSIVAAGSIVTHSVEPYTIVGGNPIKTIKNRFSEEQIEMLTSMKWWDWNDNDIANARNLIQSTDVEKLYKYYIDNIQNKN